MLERLFLDGPETPHEAKALSTETLLDILLILYNECCNSSLRKEKTLTDFIELGRTRARHCVNVMLDIRMKIRPGRCINMHMLQAVSSRSHIMVYPYPPHDNDTG